MANAAASDQRKLRGRGGGRTPVKIGVLFLCMVALSLVFIAESQHEISQATTSYSDQDTRGTTNAVEAVVVVETPPESATADPEATEPSEMNAWSTGPMAQELASDTSADTTSGSATTPPERLQVPEVTTPVSETLPPVSTPATPASSTSAAFTSIMKVRVQATAIPKPTASLHPQKYDVSTDGDLATNFVCVAWRRTGQSSPDGPPEPRYDKTCEYPIRGGASGYCVFRHKESGELRRVLLLSPNSMPSSVTFKCVKASALLRYGQDSVSYAHDTAFQFEDNRKNTLATVLADIAATSTGQDLQLPSVQELNFDKGVTMVIHEKILGSAYISIRLLRSLGCRLPIELWYKLDEVQPDHPILKELVAKYGVFLRQIVDPRATKFYTKLYAVFYSAFDHVLLLDADNFAVRDPSYLFSTPEYESTGAMFWPDMWRPASTIFHLVKEDLLWEVLGIDFVDMFEQESGQVLIDRRRHQKALNVLMYYGFSLPRVHESMEFQWGDKDLFRFAWLKTNSSFHFIERPVGLGGRYHTEKKTFCGVTMVQHDPCGEIVFLHRNADKMVAGRGNKRVWTHIEQLKVGAPIDKYKLKYGTRVFPDTVGCWALDKGLKDFFTMTPLAQFPFHNLETELIQYGEEAGELVKKKLPTPLPGYSKASKPKQLRNTKW